jgi:hypothetical protein
MTDETAPPDTAAPADPFAGVEDPANDLEHDLANDPPAGSDPDQLCKCGHPLKQHKWNTGEVLCLDCDECEDWQPVGPEQADGETIFDPDSYADPALRLDSREGRHVDEIRIPFSGTIVLNRKDKGDVAFFKSLHQGKRYDLEIEATVVADAEKSSYDKDGDEKTLAAVKSLRVTSITVPGNQAAEAA